MKNEKKLEYTIGARKEHIFLGGAREKSTNEY
jgi:hypothetical protein